MLFQPPRESGRQLKQHLLNASLKGGHEGLGEPFPEGRGHVGRDLGGEVLRGEVTELFRGHRFVERLAELGVGLGRALVDVLLEDFGHVLRRERMLSD